MLEGTAHERRKKFCSIACKALAGRALRGAANPNWRGGTKCQQCGAVFVANDCSKRRRKFCSYECHLASGGAIRAGLRAAEMARKYGAKKDANHVPIVDLLRKCGVPHIDVSGIGCGMPDLVVNIRDRFELWEIKNRKTSYGRKGLSKNQKAWADGWRGSPVYVIHDVDEALRFINGDLAGIESYGGFKVRAA